MSSPKLKNICYRHATCCHTFFGLEEPPHLPDTPCWHPWHGFTDAQLHGAMGSFKVLLRPTAPINPKHSLPTGQKRWAGGPVSCIISFVWDGRIIVTYLTQPRGQTGLRSHSAAHYFIFKIWPYSFSSPEEPPQFRFYALVIHPWLGSPVTPNTISLLSLACLSDINQYTDSQIFSTRKQFGGATLPPLDKKTRLRYWETRSISQCGSVAILKQEVPGPQGCRLLPNS